QDDFARDHQDRYQHDGSRLQYAGPSGDRKRDRVIEFDQNQYAQQRSEDILQELRIEKAHSELEIVEYIDPHHHQRIDDDDRYKKHHNVRGDSLKSLIGRKRFQVPFEHRKSPINESRDASTLHADGGFVSEPVKLPPRTVQERSGSATIGIPDDRRKPNQRAMCNPMP